MPNDQNNPEQRARERATLLKRCRDALHISQEEAASRIGSSRVSLSHWERGKAWEIERAFRVALCKLYGIEERDLLLDPTGVESEFQMPLSNEAKSVAYRWDDLPEAERVRIKNIMAEAERLRRENPDLAKRIYPDLDGLPK